MLARSDTYFACVAQPQAEAARRSAAIRIARVMCITGVVYAHAWTGLTTPVLAAQDATAQGLLRWVLMELLGRSAVPLLGMISGWLVVGSAQNRGYRAFLTGKARTILAPMVAWNALAIMLVSGAAYAGWLQAPTPTSWKWLVNALFCVTQSSEINVQMSFLRDLFVCMVAAPLLLRLPLKAQAAVGLAALVWSVSGVGFPLLLRPQILVFFVGGMLVRQAGFEIRAASWPLISTLAPYLALALASAWLAVAQPGFTGAHPQAAAALDTLLRAASAGFFWALAWRLAETWAAPLLLRIEPYVFLMFCAHLILIWLGGPLLGQISGPLGAPLYPTFLLAQPILVLAATLFLGQVLMRLTPRTAHLLSGGRLKPANGDPNSDRRRPG